MTVENASLIHMVYAYMREFTRETLARFTNVIHVITLVDTKMV